MKQGIGTAAGDADVAAAWRLLLGLRRLARSGRDIPAGAGIAPAADGGARLVPGGHREAVIRLDGGGGWQPGQAVSGRGAPLLDLYLPLCLASAARPSAVAHLGQSLDGRIATESGASQYINGAENITHLHRMRALADAVVVGARTIETDNPRLTTRLVPGDNPVRVVLDRRRRLAGHYAVFADGEAPTILVCDRDHLGDAAAGPGGAEVVGVARAGEALSVAELLAALRDRGLHGIFVEGGGVTVSRFLEQQALDRLQIAVAPLILGSGRPSVTLPPIEALSEGLRPRVRSYPMGADVLFDCALKA